MYIWPNVTETDIVPDSEIEALKCKIGNTQLFVDIVNTPNELYRELIRLISIGRYEWLNTPNTENGRANIAVKYPYILKSLKIISTKLLSIITKDESTFGSTRRYAALKTLSQFKYVESFSSDFDELENLYFLFCDDMKDVNRYTFDEEKGWVLDASKRL